MNILKSIFKFVGALLIGVVVGLVLAGLGIVLFTDITIPEFIAKFNAVSIGETFGSGLVGILAALISFPILIISHEGGHLLLGLLSGYKFVSFRIFNLTFIRVDDKLRVKKFSIAGTGGQCLLLPPDKRLKDIPTGWYNFGGVFVNLIEILLAILLIQLVSNPFISEVLIIFILMGSIMIIMNGIPMKIGGAGNDAYNMIALRKNLIAKRGLVDALRINALAQQGFRLKDMPEKWFEVPETIDYKNQLEVSIPLTAASRLVDEMEFEKALAEFQNIYRHKKDIISLYIKEMECEIVFLRLVCGKIDAAKELLTKELKSYINMYSKTMSSKIRILCVISLYIDNDRNKAVELYKELLSREDKYLIHGEVKSDLAIMRKILDI